MASVNERMFRTPHERPSGIVTQLGIEYEPPDQMPPLPVEVLWAQPLGHHQYEIRSIPFWVNGVSRFDVVEAGRAGDVDASGDLLLAERLLKRSGHSTYRCVVHDGIEAADVPFHRYWNGLAGEGCEFEALDAKFVAIDVPPSAAGPTIDALFAAGQEDFVWTLQEGLDEHPVAS